MRRAVLIRWVCGLALVLALWPPARLADAQRAAQEAVPPTFTITAASAFLRDEPRAQSTANYSVFQGQTFTILARNSNNSWLLLDYPKATKGAWILASLGTVTGDLASIPVTAVSGASGTALPSATPTLPPVRIITATPPSFGQPAEICVLLYNDANGNGRADSGEGIIAGGQLSLLDAQSSAVLQTHTVARGETGGYCFRDLPPGAYTVAAAAPAGYNATTDASVIQRLQGGEHFALTFGAQPGGASAAASSDTARWITLGLVGLLLAAAIVAFALIQRR